MPEVRDYESGNILRLISTGFRLFRVVNVPVLGSMARKYGLSILDKCDPKKVDLGYASRLIQNADRCAVGQRVCNVLNNGADHGESVFLDELADGMVKTGKAVYVDKERAVSTIAVDRKGPIMITRVSGKHMEICRSIAKNCIYWNSEKHGLKCIDRKACA
jgi:hypothetical protein